MTPDEELVILRNDMRETREAVIRMEGNLNVLITQIGDQDDTLDDHEDRIRDLEKSRWPLPQATILISILALLAAILIPLLLV